MLHYTLTETQLNLIRKPFLPDEHNFVNGNVFIEKWAIRRRLDEVDPGWEQTSPELMTETEDAVMMSGGLTISGVTRYAVGAGLITRHNVNKDTGEISELKPYDLARNKRLAYKSADSDLLPRAFKKFGGGDYLDLIPKVKNMDELKRELAKLNKSAASPQSTPVVPPSPQHWATNGGGQRINAKMKLLKLDAAHVLEHAEPGHKLFKLSDSTLTEDQFSARLDDLALALLGQPGVGGSTGTNPKV